MAVTRVSPKWEERGATTDEKGVRTLTRGWDVETNTDLTGEPAVIDAVIAVDPTAALYASHPDWAPALCRSLSAKPNGSGRVWRVTANYSSAPFEARGDGTAASTSDPNSPAPSASQNAEKPADQRPPKITVVRKEVTKVLEFDAVAVDPVTSEPVPIVNSVGDPFDPLPEVFRSHQLITFKFHRTPAQLNWQLRSGWMDTVNSRPVVILGRTYPAFSLRCVDYALDTEWDTGPTGMAFFYALNVQAEYDPGLWKVKILNTGRRKAVGILGDPVDPLTLVRIRDENGDPVDAPIPLTADGEEVPPGDPYHYVEADGYFPADWNGTTTNGAATIADPGGIIG